MTHEEAIKRHAVDWLDREAAGHPSGHQLVHARRYVLTRADGRQVEIVIIVKGVRLQLWCEAGALDSGVARAVGGTFRPGSETYSTRNTKGVQLYGRHSSLKTTDRLHRGDAWHIVPRTIGDLDHLLGAIKTGSPTSP